MGALAGDSADTVMDEGVAGVARASATVARANATKPDVAVEGDTMAGGNVTPIDRLANAQLRVSCKPAVAGFSFSARQ